MYKQCKSRNTGHLIHCGPRCHVQHDDNNIDPNNCHDKDNLYIENDPHCNHCVDLYNDLNTGDYCPSANVCLLF